MGITDKFKDIMKVVQATGNIELYKKIAGLQSDFMNLQEEIYEVREQLREAQQRLSVKSSVVCNDNMYWTATGQQTDGPFCTRCYDEKDKLMRLQRREHGAAEYICLSCNSPFATDAYKNSRDAENSVHRTSGDYIVPWMRDR